MHFTINLSIYQQLIYSWDLQICKFWIFLVGIEQNYEYDKCILFNFKFFLILALR